MKKIYTILAVAAVAACTAFAVSNYSSRDPFFESNVEALMQTELPPAIISCNSGYCGRCWEVQRFGLLYKCVWTGMQDDFCDCVLNGYV